jgi:signal peptidase
MNLAYLFLVTVVLGYFIFQIAGLPSVVIIRGKSMEPSLIEGDIVFVVPKTPEKISMGEVVVFDYKGTSLVHRVINTTYIEGVRCFVTKGDANPSTDQEHGVPPLRPRDVKGVLFSLGGSPLTIPRVGLVYIKGNDAVSYWTSGRISLILPSIILGIGVVISLKRKRSDENNGYPFSRSSITKRTLVSMIIFTVVVMQLSFTPLIPFRIHSYSMKIGVETQPHCDADFNLGSLKLGSNKNITVTLYASSAIRVQSNGFAYLEGNLSQLLTIPNETMTISPDKVANRIEMLAYAPLDAEKGVYTGKLVVYDRPMLTILPFYKLTNSLLRDNLLNIFVLDSLSNLVIALFLTVFQLSFLWASNRLADTLIWNYSNFDWIGWKISSIGILAIANLTGAASKLRMKLKWENVKTILDEITNESTHLPLHMIPILLVLCTPSFLGHILAGILLCSILSPLYMIFVKKWVWKPDITLVSLMSAIIASTFYIVEWAIMNDRTQGLWSTFSFLAPLLYMSLICLSATLPVYYLSTFIALKWVARRPGKSLDTIGDWDVVP